MGNLNGGDGEHSMRKEHTFGGFFTTRYRIIHTWSSQAIRRLLLLAVAEADADDRND